MENIPVELGEESSLIDDDRAIILLLLFPGVASALPVLLPRANSIFLTTAVDATLPPVASLSSNILRRFFIGNWLGVNGSIAGAPAAAPGVTLLSFDKPAVVPCLREGEGVMAAVAEVLAKAAPPWVGESEGER